MAININLKIQKKDLFLISAIVVFLVGVGFVIAYGGNQPSVMGHSANEIEGVCRTDGTGCPSSLLGSFGQLTNKDSLGNNFTRDSVYRAGCDGFVGSTGADAGSGDWTISFIIWAGSTNPPTAKRYNFDQRLSGSGRSISATGVIPIKKDEYFKVTHYREAVPTTTYNLDSYWYIPLDTGACAAIKQ